MQLEDTDDPYCWAEHEALLAKLMAGNEQLSAAELARLEELDRYM